MPSLFEEMQEARRRGELALPPEEPGEPEPVEVTFEYVARDLGWDEDAAACTWPGAYECSGCGALVGASRTADHAAWHRRIGG